MASEKQMLANQKNALKSTGPKTAKGKALAKRNSRKHGLWAKDVVITEGEGAEERLQRMRFRRSCPGTDTSGHQYPWTGGPETIRIKAQRISSEAVNVL